MLPALEREGIVLRGLKDLTDADKRHLRLVFQREIFPVLTPLAIDPGHPFPHLLNKSLNLAVMLRRPGDEEQLFAVVQAPAVLARFVPLPPEPGPTPRHIFTPLETVIRMHLPDLFPGMILGHDAAFRVTRDSDIEIDDDEVEDLLKTIEEEVRKRRRGAVVRLQIEDDAPVEIEQFLTTALDLDASDVIRIPGMLDLTGLFQIHGLPGYPQLRDPQFVPQLGAGVRPGARPVVGHPRPRHPGASPLRVVQPRRRFHQRRRRRRPRAGHQADPLPHQQRFAGGAGACSAPPTTASRSRPSSS